MCREAHFEPGKVKMTFVLASAILGVNSALGGAMSAFLLEEDI